MNPDGTRSTVSPVSPSNPHRRDSNLSTLDSRPFSDFSLAIVRMFSETECASSDSSSF